MAELKPAIRSLQSRMASFRQTSASWCRKVIPRLKTRRFAAYCYLLAALTIVTAAAVNTRVVEIRDGAKPSKYILTMRRSAADILKQCGVGIRKADAVDFSGFHKNYAEIKITRCYPVMLLADNRQHSVDIARGTVRDVLVKTGVALGNDDLISPSIDHPVKQGMQIRIQRVAYKTTERYQNVACSISKQPTPLLKKGNTVVIDAGKSGQKTITSLQRFIDGVLAEEKVISEKLTKLPINGKMLVGTAKSTPISRMEPGGTLLISRGSPSRYTKCLVGKATAYSARGHALTASGRRASVGVVAVDPKIIPYGTRLYITSTDGSIVYGYAVAGDTGGFATNGSGVLVDLYFNTFEECRMFGVHQVKIYTLA